MTVKKKVLNLYCGLGGNRKLWDNVEVTAVELNESIANFYKDRYPQDKVVIGDAHKYLLDYYMEFDFIWSSITCPSHSRARFWASKNGTGKIKPIYPDFKLYEEIVFLKHFYKGKWLVENVNPYYEPLLDPAAKIGRHYFWSNFEIANINFPEADIKNGNIGEWEKLHGIDTSGYSFSIRKDKVLRNCVHPDLGLHIMNESNRVGIFQL